MSSLNEIQAEIGVWHKSKFPEERYGDTHIDWHVSRKVLEEAKELLEAENEIDVASEAADVAIALMALCSRMDINLEEVIAAKMQINEKRVWIWDGDRYSRQTRKYFSRFSLLFGSGY